MLNAMPDEAATAVPRETPVRPALSIGEVAERTGLSTHTLRFYEREGLFVEPIRRAPGGRRVYSENDVEWLNLCVMLRATGMPLPAIRRYTELVRAGAGNEGERLALLRRHQDQVRADIDRLHQCLDLIGYKVRVYEDIVEAVSAGPEREAPSAAKSR
jgi:DNA-binding transcriptional MerR regulator